MKKEYSDYTEKDIDNFSDNETKTLKDVAKHWIRKFNNIQNLFLLEELRLNEELNKLKKSNDNSTDTLKLIINKLEENNKKISNLLTEN